MNHGHWGQIDASLLGLMLIVLAAVLVFGSGALIVWLVMHLHFS